MNTCLAPNQTQSLFFSGPSRFSSLVKTIEPCCLEVGVNFIGALAGKIDLWCSPLDDSPTATLTKQNQKSYCMPNSFHTSVKQYGWSDHAKGSGININLFYKFINCSKVPLEPPSPIADLQTFEFGLPAGQTGNLSPKKFEMSTLRRTFSTIGSNESCQQLTMLHRGSEANYASAYCTHSYQQEKPSSYTGYIFIKKDDTFTCPPVFQDDKLYPSNLRISYNSYYWTHLLDSNNTGKDASVVLELEMVPCDNRNTPDYSLNSSSAYSLDPSSLALALLISAVVSSMFV